MLPATRLKATGGGFSRQRMVKSGTWEPRNNGTLTVTGWASDASWPSVVTSDKLVVSGVGPVTVTASIDGSTDYNAVTIQLMQNSTVIATASMPAARGVRTASATVTVANGDTLWVRIVTSDTSWPTVYAGSYVDVSS